MLGDALGIEVPDNEFTTHLPPNLRRQNTFVLIETIIRFQSERHPLLLLLEDVQWADDLSLDLVAHLVKSLRDAPIFFALIYRPNENLSLLDEVDSWMDTHRMQLEPLTPRESRDLISLLLGERTIAPAVEEGDFNSRPGQPLLPTRDHHSHRRLD